jgi:glycine/D-amino acid oxidase-like deaminating enzyme
VFDVAIIGGGVAGLMTALRFADIGATCIVLERDLLGSGATTRGHGTVHSGAMFAELHPELVPMCQEAMPLFSQSFPEVHAGGGDCLYFGEPERVATFRARWKALDIPFTDVSEAVATRVLEPAVAGRVASVTLADRALASGALVTALAARCLAWGVRLCTETPARGVVVRNRRAVGVAMGLGSEVAAETIVLCAGLGLHELLARAESRLAGKVRSRLDIVVAFPEAKIDHSVFCLDYGGPAVAVTPDHTALASVYRGPQAPISASTQFPVLLERVDAVRRNLATHLRHDLLGASPGYAHMCAKTEIATGRADGWSVEPYPVSINHEREEGIARLWTLVPGKMTLAFHASRDLVARVTGKPVPLALPDDAHVEARLPAADALVARQPWLTVAAVDGES